MPISLWEGTGGVRREQPCGPGLTWGYRAVPTCAATPEQLLSRSREDTPDVSQVLETPGEV